MNNIVPFLYYDRKIKTARYNEYLRDTLNPFDISDRCFIDNYRMPKHLVMQLIEEIKPHIEEPTGNISAVPLHLEVLASLNFFASGSHQRRVGLDAFAVMSQSKLSKTIAKISEVIGSKLILDRVKFPYTLADANHKKNEFFRKYRIPGIVGLIDCTHIAMAHLNKKDEYAYLNRKNFHSINVQMICDYNMRIMNVNARFPGSTHDSFIWGGSTIVPIIKDLNLQDSKTWLFGDSGYALKPYMMVPYKEATTDAQISFNVVHSKIRNGIERCFGLLKSRFRCLKRTSGHLHYDHAKAAKIIHSCVTLHNFLIDHNYPIDDFEIIDDDDSVPIRASEENSTSGERNREFLANLIQEEHIIE